MTSHDFLEPLLDRLSLQSYLPQARVAEVRRQAQTFVVMCSTGEPARGQFCPPTADRRISDFDKDHCRD